MFYTIDNNNVVAKTSPTEIMFVNVQRPATSSDVGKVSPMLAEITASAVFVFPVGEKASIWLRCGTELSPPMSFGNTGTSPANISMSTSYTFTITDDEAKVVYVVAKSTNGDVPVNERWFSLKLL